MFLTNPLRVFFPITLNPFKVVGYQGLASHGATIGILIALYLGIKYRFNISLFPPKFKLVNNTQRPGSYLWITTPAVIIIAIAGGCIRLGNFMNSEVFGKPTGSNYGILFARNITDELMENYDFIQDVSVSKRTDVKGDRYQPINCSIKTKRLVVTNQKSLDRFVKNKLLHTLTTSKIINQHLMLQPTHGGNDWYNISTNKNGEYVITFQALGIVRHPSQLYEAISCFVLFFILFFTWKYNRNKIGDGEIAGIFLIYVFGLRFLYEFFKETKSLSSSIPLNIAHLLSIPAVLLGVAFVIAGRRNRKLKSTGKELM